MPWGFIFFLYKGGMLILGKRIQGNKKGKEKKRRINVAGWMVGVSQRPQSRLISITRARAAASLWRHGDSCNQCFLFMYKIFIHLEYWYPYTCISLKFCLDENNILQKWHTDKDTKNTLNCTLLVIRMVSSEVHLLPGKVHTVPHTS